MDKAVAAVREAAESEQARDIVAKAKATAATLAQKAKSGAITAADALLEAKPRFVIDDSVTCNGPAGTYTDYHKDTMIYAACGCGN